MPVGLPDGCLDEASNRIHLHVCWLELEALATLTGEELVTKVLLAMPYYREIDRTVIHHRHGLAAIFEPAGMGLPPPPS